MSRGQLTILLWSALGAAVGFALGLLCTMLFQGIGFGFGVGVGVPLASALGFSGYLYARDRATRH